MEYKYTLVDYSVLSSGYQWFILYEFKVNDNSLFNLNEKEILNVILGSKVLGNSLYHKELSGKNIGLNLDDPNTAQRPYYFEKLSSEDFIHLIDRHHFLEWVEEFRNHTWNDDKDDAIALLESSLIEIEKHTNMETGAWLLDKDNIDDDSPKFHSNHLVYIYFKTIVQIDKRNLLIRTFDYGYD